MRVRNPAINDPQLHHPPANRPRRRRQRHTRLLPRRPGAQLFARRVCPKCEVLIYAQLFDADADGERVPTCDNHPVCAACLKHFQAVSVQCVKRFDFFAVIADKDAPVGQNADHPGSTVWFGSACKFRRNCLHGISLFSDGISYHKCRLKRFTTPTQSVPPTGRAYSSAPISAPSASVTTRSHNACMTFPGLRWRDVQRRWFLGCV